MRYLAAATAALALVSAPVAAKRTTAQYTSLTVFGDSLVDAGNIYTATGGLTPRASTGYFQGRFTNGYDYTDLLSIDLFGTPTKASLQGGTNFAYGGARATTTSGVPDLNEQLALFNTPGRTIDANGLYILNFGGNDIFAAQTSANPAGYPSRDAFLQDAALKYATAVQTLNNLGVRNILLTGFPVATSPYSTQAEGYLTSNLAGLSLNANTTLFRFSYLDFFGRVVANPTAYGLAANLNTTSNCVAAQAQASGCVGYFSFDGTHPVAQVQRALYEDLDRQFSLTAAVPEPAAWGLMIVGFGALGTVARRRRRGALAQA